MLIFEWFYYFERQLICTIIYNNGRSEMLMFIKLQMNYLYLLYDNNYLIALEL
jgi:hypothetical protein